MRFVKVKDEERTGDVAINLDLIREAHFGGGLLHLYFERSAASQDDVTLQVRMHKKYGRPWASADCERNEAGKIQCQSPIAAYGRNPIYRARQVYLIYLS
jgi:hypothetical protein